MCWRSPTHRKPDLTEYQYSVTDVPCSVLAVANTEPINSDALPGHHLRALAGRREHAVGLLVMWLPALLETVVEAGELLLELV